MAQENSLESEEAASAGLGEEEGARLALHGWLTMKEAATKCRCSLFWFSRNWRSWGLRPAKLGRLLFDAKEVEMFLRSRVVRPRGRPAKVRRLYAQG